MVKKYKYKVLEQGYNGWGEDYAYRIAGIGWRNARTDKKGRDYLLIKGKKVYRKDLDMRGMIYANM